MTIHQCFNVSNWSMEYISMYQHKFSWPVTIFSPKPSCERQRNKAADENLISTPMYHFLPALVGDCSKSWHQRSRSYRGVHTMFVCFCNWSELRTFETFKLTWSYMYGPCRQPCDNAFFKTTLSFPINICWDWYANHELGDGGGGGFCCWRCSQCGGNNLSKSSDLSTTCEMRHWTARQQLW